MADHIKRQQDEIRRIKEENEKTGAILQEKNVDIQTVEEYKNLEEQLKKQGLSIGAPRILVSILETINQIGYDPRKIVMELARIKSFRQRERQLKKGCGILESRATQYKKIIPLCEQITRFGIGIGELLAFHAAVIKKTDTEKLSPDRAAFRVIEEIRDYNNLGGMKKQLAEVATQIYMMNQISARQNKAIIALAKLEFYGITEDQILKMCREIDANGHNSNSYSAWSINSKNQLYSAD